MRNRSMIVAALVVALALPLSASQFVNLPFDQVARDAQYVVRATVGDTWSAWDDAHEVIYTYATIRVGRYFGETTGPDTLVVREVGGTVDGYTQEAIGFPELRSGEDVVLMLSSWEEGADFRIQAFNQGKYLVRNRGGVEVLIEDPVKQGDLRLSGRDFSPRSNRIGVEVPALRLDEFAAMVDDARSGGRPGFERQQ